MGQYIGAPIYLFAIGQRNDKPLPAWLGDDGDLVALASLAPGVAQDGKMAKAFPCNVDQELIGNMLVEDSDTIADGLFKGHIIALLTAS